MTWNPGLKRPCGEPSQRTEACTQHSGAHPRHSSWIILYNKHRWKFWSWWCSWLLYLLYSICAVESASFQVQPFSIYISASTIQPFGARLFLLPEQLLITNQVFFRTEHWQAGRDWTTSHWRLLLSLPVSHCHTTIGDEIKNPAGIIHGRSHPAHRQNQATFQDEWLQEHRNCCIMMTSILKNDDISKVWFWTWWALIGFFKFSFKGTLVMT